MNRKKDLYLTWQQQERRMKCMSEYRLMTEDQRGMVELVKEFLMKEYLPLVPEYDQKGEYPMEIHKKMGEL